MNTERTSLVERAARHAALADVARLMVVEELALGDRSPSELQVVVDLPSNLLAHHLKVLEDAGLVARRRSEGDRRRTYLTLLDSSLVEPPTADGLHVGRILFVCSANSARSQLAAALWRRASDVPVASAGTRPAERVSDGAKEVAKRRSLKLIGSTPRMLSDVAADDDYVVAVCDNAYEELSPAVNLHWSVPDPVAQGNDAAFDLAYTELERRVTNLAPRLIAS
ncbi:helix-turn-helix domain-containing protein [Aeromicrobium sp. 9AM]|uniref:arsenate reductase/protein-tyrosine-phosphatase family protein n=1 Tax=Aeromicrobium sp. 9AM TaxID=2653126 RepID=UPI00135998F4|nr:helix-turn-helix domain-containing protein [Aeromicrobium sp. 9AM]